MIENWLDAVAKVFEMDNGKGGTVRSFRLYERADIPGALSSDLYPCAISYFTDCKPEYAAGGVDTLIWQGLTELHILPNLQMDGLPYLLLFVGRVIKAAAANYQLGGLVEHFLIPKESGAIQLVELGWGEDRNAHRGLLVHWEVKENITGALTFGV
jgi:hypothetical protein